MFAAQVHIFLPLLFILILGLIFISLDYSSVALGPWGLGGWGVGGFGDLGIWGVRGSRGEEAGRKEEPVGIEEKRGGGPEVKGVSRLKV